MRTPEFHLTQDDEYVYVNMKMPAVREADVEMFYAENLFFFSCEPYFLRLTFPEMVLSNEQFHKFADKDEAKFDSEKMMMTISVPKLVKGTDFGDLSDNRKFQENLLPESPEEFFMKIIAEQEQQRQQQEQEQESSPKEDSPSIYSYGFQDSYKDILEHMSFDSLRDIFDITEPGKKSPEERTRVRLLMESAKFDADHYLADRYEEEKVEGPIMMVPSWMEWRKKPFEENEDILDEDDRIRLDSLPKRDMSNLTKEDVNHNLLIVLDILYAYCYDMRTTEFEHNSESAWTITKLSPSLCCMDSSYFRFKDNQMMENIKLATHDCCSYVMATCMRRSIIFPLYRNVDLAKQVYIDVCNAMGVGKNAILKFFLDIHRIFEENEECYYLLNTLFINDLCLFIRDSVQQYHLNFLADFLLKKMTDGVFKKDVFNLGLNYFEMIAEMELKRLKDKECELVNEFKALNMDQEDLEYDSEDYDTRNVQDLPNKKQKTFSDCEID